MWPAADGRRGHRPPGAPRRARGAHLLRQVHHQRRCGGEPDMSTTQSQPKERSVPKPVFTDAEAGSREFPSSQSRTFTYFTPHRRRATVYEDVTVDVQPDPERYLTQGWIYGFADGP